MGLMGPMGPMGPMGLMGPMGAMGLMGLMGPQASVSLRPALSSLETPDDLGDTLMYFSGSNI